MKIEANKGYVDAHFLQIHAENELLADVGFENCAFDKCTFIECEFRACTFVDCSFANCNLVAPKFPNCSLRGVGFRNSKVVGVDWTQAQPHDTQLPIAISFDACTIDYSNFFGLKLQKTEFTKCIVHEAHFAEADLTGSSFEATDLEGTEFLHTNLTRVNFTRAYNYSIDPTANILKGAKFSLPEAVSLLRGLGITVDWGQRP